MKFINENENTGTKITFDVCQEATIEEVLEDFQNFLSACGYVIDRNECLVMEKMDQ